MSSPGRANKAVILAAPFLLVGCASQSTASTDGPVPTPDDHGYGGLHVAVGKSFSDTMEVLQNEGEEPVRVTSVEFINTPRQLRLVEALIGVGRTGNNQSEPQWPPRLPENGTLIPAEGAVLQPVTVQEAQGDYPGYVLAMAVEATEPGKWVRGGYRVNYEADGRPYTLEVVAHITICTDDFLEADGTCLMEIPE